jgi:arylsulfatase A-like enzyme
MNAPPAPGPHLHDLVSRRSLVAGIGAAAAGSTLLRGPATARPGTGPRSSQRRPNILWLVSEDNVPALGCYGDPIASTPHIDALAADGVRYENAFSMAPTCAPSRLGLITGICPEAMGPGQHHRAQAELPPGTTPLPVLLRERGYYCTNNAKTDYNAPLHAATIWDASSAKAHWRDRPRGAPFFAVFNDNTTHESQLFGAYAGGRTSPGEVIVPPYLPDTRVIRRDRARWYDNISRMDSHVGDRLRELERAGVLDDTIVFYYGDNGGVTPRTKRFCYDSGLRVPLVIRFGRNVRDLSPYRPGSTVTRPVSGVDLPATVIALAGARKPAIAHGASVLSRSASDRRRYAFGMRNRVDETYDMQRTVRDERFRYIRNYHPHRIYGQHEFYQFRQAGYVSWRNRYVAGELNELQSRFWRRKPPEELYDLVADPHETVNLADVRAHRRTRTRLRDVLDRHLIEVNDNGFIPEGLALEGYADSRLPSAYPIRRVVEVAGRASRGEARELPALVASLDDEHEVVRTWAALGLAVLGKEAAPARDRLRRVLAEEPSAHVRTQAAEALARLDEPGAIEALGEILTTDPGPRTRLQAANVLAALGERARPAIKAVRIATGDDDDYVVTKAKHVLDVLEGRYPHPS